MKALEHFYKWDVISDAEPTLLGSVCNVCVDCHVELLNQKTEEIERIMNEKKAVIADVLQIPLHEYDTITEVCQHFVCVICMRTLLSVVHLYFWVFVIEAVR